MADLNRKKSPIWHPFTQHALQTEMISVETAEGAYLTTKNGDKILDAISSWWTITHGHRHPHIMNAIRRQTELLDHVIFAGFTHEPAEQLAKELVALTPDGLDYVFYSDSGSTAVEVAIKMALGFWRNSTKPRSRIAVMQNSYHGDTIGAMSVGARGVFNAAYEPLLFDVTHIPFPIAGQEMVSVDALEKACRTEMLAAFIVEPLILGAGGMLTYDAETLRAMKETCSAHDVLFIADEIMTGWGRTGTLFACEQANICPDIACYAKGITGGSIPLAVTLCRADIFDAHYSTDRTKTFYHSSSYTANPIACAAAIANIEIWKNEPVLERINKLSQRQSHHTERFRDNKNIENVRTCGTILALDFKTKESGYLANLGPSLYSYCLERGFLLRPLGNTIYCMPPYCVSNDDLEAIYQTIENAAADLIA